MLLVVDTNILFSFFNRNSAARDIVLLNLLLLHSPSFALHEIEKHKTTISEKFSLSESQFSLIAKTLRSVIEFSDVSEYSDFLESAENVSPDPNDIDFFALG